MDFSDTALAKFLQVAPELGPTIVNFSEVSEELGDPNTQVGLFTLRIGSGLATVPVVAKGETVFPVDSVFLEAEGQFKPLSKFTIQYLLNSSPTTGKAVKTPDTVDRNPNLNNLINPPRTGKFVYSSASRLTEFLAILPSHIKSAAFEKISAEQSVYNVLDKLFGLKAVFEVLNQKSDVNAQINNTQTGPALVQNPVVSVITTPREIADLGSESAAAHFLEHGYAIKGNPFLSRTAVAYQPYNQIGSFTVVRPDIDGGRDFNIVFRDGSSKEAFLPKYHILNGNGGRTVSIFTDGSYARGDLITNGDPLERTQVLETLFSVKPPKLLKDLERDETFVLFTTSGQALGPFHARSVTLSASGAEVNTGRDKILGMRNFTKEVDKVGDSIFVPYNVIVYVLGEDVSDRVETNVNVASDKKELITSQYLGAELDLRHDGVEFSANGRAVGGFPSALKLLVEQENLDPAAAHSFLKQAEEMKFVKVFLSKKASSTDFNPAEIPQYGAIPSELQSLGMNGSFMPALQDAVKIGDGQAVESTIISQLLQEPELFEYIQEYLPELESTIDRLGRVLLLSRVRMDDLASALDSDSVFSLISQIKNVYRQLGDTTLKLKGIVNAGVDFEKGESTSKTAG